MAKERLRNLETSLATGVLDTQLPTKTRIADIVESDVKHIHTTKTKNSIKVDTWYLRSIFGPICPALEGSEERKLKKAGGKGFHPRHSRARRGTRQAGAGTHGL